MKPKTEKVVDEVWEKQSNNHQMQDDLCFLQDLPQKITRDFDDVGLW